MTSQVFVTEALGAEYGRLLKEILATGEESAPRGQLIRELRPLTVTLLDPRACVVKRPGMSRAFMFAEQMLLLAGEHDVPLLQRYSSCGASMLNHYGAYGPRIRDQLTEVVRELRLDCDSRRAMAYVGRPSDLTYATELNMPCTTSYHFMLRDGRLECVTHMRSWDVVWGLSYDIPNAAQLQMCVAADLEVDLGRLTFVANSGHIYERHFGLAVGTTDYRLPSLANAKTGMLDDTARDARKALLIETLAPGGKAATGAVLPQWVEPFAAFRRQAERV